MSARNLPVGCYDATEIESRPFLAARMVMAEADFYQPIKKGLEELFASKGKSFYLEVTATRRWSEKLKGKIPQGREIVFTFLKKRPDLLGFVEGQYSSNFVTVEVKEQIKKLDDIYQAKLYKEVFDAKYGFLITTEPIPEEIKRLCNSTFSILHSATDSIYSFLVIGHFDPIKGHFTDWCEKNPFEEEQYWK